MKSTFKRPQAFFVTLLLLLLAMPTIAMAEIKVVTTIGDFAAMSRAILQDDGDTINLVRPGEDPHYVEPRPSFARHLNQADMVVFVGMDLEIGWLPSLITRARNSDIQSGQTGHFDASRFIQAQQVPLGSVDRSMGDVHAAGNPHYSTDPRQMARVAIAFGDALGELYPAKADEFHERSRNFARDNIRFAQKWEEKFAELSEESRQMIPYHESWAYVSNWLNIETPLTLEPLPGVSPNPRHVSRVIDTMKNRNVEVIFQLEYYPTRTANNIAERTGATVVQAPGQARDDEEYLEQMDNMIRPLYEAMKSISESDS